jgi:heat shock protein HtpX
MPVTFRDLIAQNKRNSTLLVVLFVLFTGIVALVLALAIVLYVNPGASTEASLWQSAIVGAIAAGISLLFAWFSFYNGDKLVLAVSGARQIEKKDDPQLFNVVEEMAIAAGVPMPKVYLIEDSAPNAFATGRDPEHGVVAITRGLRDKLTREELQGVIAHEMSHVGNYDIRLMLLLAVLIGTIVMLADFFWRILYFAPRQRGGMSGGDRDDRKGGNPLMLIVLILAIILAIIAPILAQIIQLAVSRQREYLADATAVQLTRNPIGLANALRKIDADPDVLETANRGTAHLYIANPIKKFEARASTMFASHPPIKERIARLLALAHEQVGETSFEA